MPFQPEVDQELIIDDVTYRVAVHPAAPGMPYGQEGRQAIVYQLVAQDGGKQALKVFKPRYRLPALVGQATRIAPLAGLPGLSVCRRTVLSATRYGDLLRQHPDLIYAVLMPWVEGPTWMEAIVGKRELAPQQSLALARALAEILATMEEHGLAHCDLSGPNVLLPGLLPSPSLGRGAGGEGTPLSLPGRGVGGEGWVALVDVEQLYGPDLRRPELLPGGSPGYAHKTAPDGLWGSTADRFAGAVLLGEMLGWCDARVREASWGENYFDPQEMQREGERFQTLGGVLEERWGAGVAGLFERAWRSEVLADCATFGEWLVMLPEEVPAREAPPADVTNGEQGTTGDVLQVLMDLGRQFEEQGQLESALQTYRRACELAPAGSGLAEELALIVQGLEAKQKEAIAPELQSVPMEKVVEAVTPVLLPVEEAKAEVMPTQPQSLPEEGTDTETIAPTPETALERELALIAQEVWAKPQEEAPSLELQPLVVEAEAEVTTPPADEETDLDRLFDDGLAAYERGEWAKARELLSEVVRQRPTYERHGKQVKSLLAEVEAHLAPLRQRKAIVWAWALGGLAVVVLGFLLLGGSRLITAWLSSSRATPIVVEVAVEVTSTPRPPVAPGPTATPESMPGTVSVSAVVPKPVTIRPDESAQVTYRFVNNTGVRVHIFSHKWFWTTTYGRKIEGHDGQEGYPDFSIPAGQSVSWVDEVYLPCEIVRQVANWGVESVILHTTFVGTDEKKQDIVVETELNITIDAELMVRDDSVYDDFSVTYSGSYDQTRWRSWYDSVDGITQENGVLGFSYTKAQGLFARGYPCFSLNSLKAPTFFEARLRLDNYAPTASLHLKLHTDLASGEYWVSECGMWGIEEQQLVAYCVEWAEEGFLYGPEFRSAGPGEWHTVRIEVDPTTTTFTYYIDGVEVSSHVPANAVQLKTASFTLVIENIEGANGYVDDVRVGELER